MLDSTPQTIKNNFEDQLRKLSHEDKYQTIKNYYDSLIKEIDNEKKIIKDHLYTNIDDRIDTTRYFYFPTETNAKNMNCFERATSMYFALKETYPESEPSLVFLTQKQENVHASVLFTHQGELYGADPSYRYLDKIVLENKRIKVLNDDEKEKEIKFDNMTQADEHFLNYLAKKLRSDSGVVDFLYESGQRASYSTDMFWIHQSLFMKVKPDKTIISEIRLHGEDFPEDDACIRFTTNPNTGLQEVNFLRYKSESWGVLVDAYNEPISSKSPYHGKNVGETNHITRLQDIACFVNNQDFMNYSNDEIKAFSEDLAVQLRFMPGIEIAKDIGESTYWSFMKYLRHRFGDHKHLTYNQPELSIDATLQEAVKAVKLLGENAYERCGLQMTPPLLKFIEDQKKYSSEVIKQIK